MAINKIRSLSEVTKYLNGKTSLWLDIDNTLIECDDPSMMCPNIAFTESIKQGLKDGIYKKHQGLFFSYCNPRYMKLVKWFNNYVENRRWKLTEKKLPVYFKTWRRIVNDDLLLITARGLEVSKATELALYNNGLKMVGKYKGHVKIPTPSFRSGISSRKIIYCGGYPKDKIVKQFMHVVLDDLKEIKIVMIDDIKENLISMHALLKEYDIEFVGLHYEPKEETRPDCSQ